MRLIERIRNRINQQEPDKKSFSWPTHIEFFDFNDPDKSRQVELEPGYYITLHGVTRQTAEDREFFFRVLPTLTDYARRYGPKKEQGAYIPLDNKGTKIDLDGIWKFETAGYDVKRSIWVLKAELIPQEEAAALIVREINKRKVV